MYMECMLAKSFVREDGSIQTQRAAVTVMEAEERELDEGSRSTDADVKQHDGLQAIDAAIGHRPSAK